MKKHSWKNTTEPSTTHSQKGGIQIPLQRFYTYAPKTCEYPYILRNIKQKPQETAEHEIVDIGIYDLLNPPYRHPEKKIEAWKALKTDGWKVVPDCPDLKGEFGKPIDFSNTDYSWELLTSLYDPDDEHQMPVIQSKYGDLKSLKWFCESFLKEYGQPVKIAVGSVCKMDSMDVSYALLKTVRRYFPHAWIHAFGLRFHHLRKCKSIIDSFDSTSWTFPRTGGLPSAKNEEMRIEYFYDYLERLNQVSRVYDVEQTVLEVIG